VLSEAGLYDRVVVQEIITEFSKTKQINSNALVQKAIIIHDADLLSKGAQQALRRTMEKFSVNVRIIFVASSLSKFIPAIRSRCMNLRIPLSNDSSVQIELAL
jgi:replication factor C subunit 3/5